MPNRGPCKQNRHKTSRGRCLCALYRPNPGLRPQNPIGFNGTERIGGFFSFSAAGVSKKRHSRHERERERERRDMGICAQINASNVPPRAHDPRVREKAAVRLPHVPLDVPAFFNKRRATQTRTPQLRFVRFTIKKARNLAGRSRGAKAKEKKPPPPPNVPPRTTSQKTHRATKGAEPFTIRLPGGGLLGFPVAGGRLPVAWCGSGGISATTFILNTKRQIHAHTGPSPPLLPTRIPNNPE